MVLMICQLFHEECCIRSHGYDYNTIIDSIQERLSLQTIIPRWTVLAILFPTLLKRKIHVSKLHIVISSVSICCIKIEVWLVHVLTLNSVFLWQSGGLQQINPHGVLLRKLSSSLSVLLTRLKFTFLYVIWNWFCPVGQNTTFSC